MNIPDYLIAEIKASNNIIDVISKYVSLKRSSSNSPWYIGQCPFHEETEGSFKVNSETQSWFCYGCNKGSKQDGKGSDVFAFIQEIEEISFPEACELLANRVGIKFVQEQEDPVVTHTKQIMTDYNKRYAKNLFDPNNQLGVSALEYLHSRGLSDHTIIHWRLGLVPQDELNMRTDITGIAGRFSIAIIENKPNNAATLGMAYRRPSKDSGKPKYINDVTSPCFTKGNNLYGLNYAAPNIKKEKMGIIVECYFGTIVLHQNGIENVVSPMGTSITEEQLRLMKRYATNWLFMFDGDNAGRDAALRVLPMALKAKIKPFVIFLPEGDDADTFINRIGKESFEKWMNSSKEDLLKWYMNKTLDTYDQQILKLRSEAQHKIMPLLDSLPSDVQDIMKSYTNKRLNL